MIKINFLEKRKKSETDLMGIPITAINFKFFGVALLLYFIVPWQLNSYFDGKISDVQTKIQTIEDSISKIKEKLKGQDELQNEIDEFKEQEKKLNEKLDVIKQIINFKKNPTSIMLYVAKNIPKELWLESFEIKDDKILLKGYADTYSSLGTFIENLESSMFFEDKFDLQSKAADLQEGNRRGESFEVKGKIKRYE